MKTIKANETILITGWFRKRYWHLVPGVGVFELERISYKEQLRRGKQNA
jgi:hypothetical protein